MIATPFNNGPPTIIPGTVALPEVSSAEARRARMRRTMRSRWTLLGGAAILAAGAILLAPLAEDFLPGMSSAPQPTRVAPARAPVSAIEPVQSPPVINTTLLQGPWRCTNQRTGVSADWSYGANGALIFHGDVLSEKPPSREIAETAPAGWTIVGPRLSHTYRQHAPDTYTITQLSLTQLRYGGERSLEIECRRLGRVAYGKVPGELQFIGMPTLVDGRTRGSDDEGVSPARGAARRKSVPIHVSGRFKARFRTRDPLQADIDIVITTRLQKHHTNHQAHSPSPRGPVDRRCRAGPDGRRVADLERQYLLDAADRQGRPAAINDGGTHRRSCKRPAHYRLPSVAVTASCSVELARMARKEALAMQWKTAESRHRWPRDALS